MYKRFVWLSLVDLVLFVVAWAVRGTPSVSLNQTLISVLYWGSSFVGLGLAVFGFLVLTRGRAEQMARSTLCILFALTPGCVGLVALLSHLGTKPV
jgi:hypothetical protein